MISTLFSRLAIGMIAAIPLLGLSLPLHAKDFIKAERPQQRGYSQAVITERQDRVACRPDRDRR
jgi:hypothetical protein